MFAIPLFFCVAYGALHLGVVGVVSLINLLYKNKKALGMFRILGCFAWVIYLALPLWASFTLGLEGYKFGVYKSIMDKDRGVYILDIYALCALYVCAIWFLKKTLARVQRQIARYGAESKSEGASR